MGRFTKILRTLSGRSTKTRADAAALAVNKCRQAISVLENQDVTLQTQMRLAEEEARALLRMGDKAGTEIVLKKKELLLRESDRLQRTKVSLLSQILLVETAETRSTAVEALATGLLVHKQMSAKMFNDAQLEKLHDDLLDQACFEAEVSNLMAQSFEAITSFDDDTNASLERTLEDLQTEEIGLAIGRAVPNAFSITDTVDQLLRTTCIGTPEFAPALTGDTPSQLENANESAPSPVRMFQEVSKHAAMNIGLSTGSIFSPKGGNTFGTDRIFPSFDSSDLRYDRGS